MLHSPFDYRSYPLWRSELHVASVQEWSGRGIRQKEPPIRSGTLKDNDYRVYRVYNITFYMIFSIRKVCIYTLYSL